MDEFNNNIRQEISKVLMKIGISANLQGFDYLKLAIYKSVKDKVYLRKVTKVLYPEIGKEFDVSGSIVERSMRHAVDSAYLKNKFCVMNDIFDVDVIEPYYKPSSSELIALITEYIKWMFNLESDEK